ncbi:MAG: siderophore ABC transporter substrate-binding protein [Bacillus sp. (in: firmicutes)]
MKKWLLTCMLAIFAVVLAACGSDEASKEEKSADTPKEEAKTVTVQHKYGEVEVPVNPEKVVVFDFGSLDTIHALGATDSVVATAKDSLPEYLSDFNKDDVLNAGGLKEPDFEAIHEAQPDLIIISGRQADSYDKFAEIAPTVYVELDAANYMDSFESNVNMLAEIYGKEDAAKEKLAEVEAAVEEAKGKVDTSKKGLIVLSNAGEISAYGAGSRFGMIHDVLGVAQADEKIEVSTHGQNVTSEYVLEKNPDYLFVIDRDAAVGTEGSSKETIENAIIKKTNAFKDGKIIYLNPQYWYLSGGGIESVTEMVKEVSEGVVQ